MVSVTTMFTIVLLVLVNALCGTDSAVFETTKPTDYPSYQDHYWRYLQRQKLPVSPPLGSSVEYENCDSDDEGRHCCSYISYTKLYKFLDKKGMRNWAVQSQFNEQYVREVSCKPGKQQTCFKDFPLAFANIETRCVTDQGTVTLLIDSAHGPMNLPVTIDVGCSCHFYKKA